jgi:transposase
MQHHQMVQTWLADVPELKAPQILERLREHGYSGGLTIVRDLVRRLRPRSNPKVYLTMHYLPGEVLLVDWADFGFALPGVPRRVSAFVASLGNSRYLYLEFTLSQAMRAFLRTRLPSGAIASAIIVSTRLPGRFRRWCSSIPSAPRSSLSHHVRSTPTISTATPSLPASAFASIATNTPSRGAW